MKSSSFSTLQIQFLVQEFADQLAGHQFLACSSADLHRFSLLFEKTEKKAVFFCFTPPFLRFHLSARLPSFDEPHRHPLEPFLKGMTLSHVEQINEDRILKLTFKGDGKKLFFLAEFFEKHPNYYLLDDQGHIKFALFPSTKTYYNLPALLSSPSPSQPAFKTSAEVERFYSQLEKDWIFQREKKAIQSSLTQAVKRLKKRQLQLEQEYQTSLEWQKVQHEGDLLKAHFHLLKKGLSQLSVWDWETNQPHLLFLNPHHSPQEELAKRFRKAKKLQAALPHLQRQLELIRQTLKDKENQLEELEKRTNLKDILLLKPQSRLPVSRQKKAEQAKLPYREFRSATGILIWVGKNARANDRLTFSLAKGLDWWLHTKDIPGSHIVIRTKKGEEPDRETLADAAQLALCYSQAKDKQEAEVCLTQRKYVTRLGKIPGKVQLSKHKTIWVRFDPKRYQALKERSSSSLE